MSPLNEIFTCRRCGADWDGERKRGQKPIYCTPCRPLAIRERDTAAARRWREANAENLRAKARARYAANPEHHKEMARRLRYGITKEQFDSLLARQGGGCGICGVEKCQTGRVMCIDHDHSCCPQGYGSCGKCVRGILCHRCNSTLLPGYEALPPELRDSEHINTYLTGTVERDPWLSEAA